MRPHIFHIYELFRAANDARWSESTRHRLKMNFYSNLRPLRLQTRQLTTYKAIKLFAIDESPSSINCRILKGGRIRTQLTYLGYNFLNTHFKRFTQFNENWRVFTAKNWLKSKRFEWKKEHPIESRTWNQMALRKRVRKKSAKMPKLLLFISFERENRKFIVWKGETRFVHRMHESSIMEWDLLDFNYIDRFNWITHHHNWCMDEMFLS